jgi:hypothetical protein
MHKVILFLTDSTATKDPPEEPMMNVYMLSTGMFRFSV